jgi:hypothetical protein
MTTELPGLASRVKRKMGMMPKIRRMVFGCLLFKQDFRLIHGTKTPADHFSRHGAEAGAKAESMR